VGTQSITSRLPYLAFRLGSLHLQVLGPNSNANGRLYFSIRLEEALEAIERFGQIPGTRLPPELHEEVRNVIFLHRDYITRLEEEGKQCGLAPDPEFFQRTIEKFRNGLPRLYSTFAKLGETIAIVSRNGRNTSALMNIQRLLTELRQIDNRLNGLKFSLP
jgi:hypothetical protein